MEFRVVNHNGKLLLELCKSVSARILNGRLVGDTSGRFTRLPIYQNVDVTDKLYGVPKAKKIKILCHLTFVIHLQWKLYVKDKFCTFFLILIIPYLM